MTAPRTWTSIDGIADSYTAGLAALDPVWATLNGVLGHDAELPPCDPDWHDQLSVLRRRTLADLSTAEPQDASDRITVTDMRERLGIAEELHDAHEDIGDLDNIASWPQAIRDVFDLMPTATADDWSSVATRLAAVPCALDGYAESLRVAAAAGVVPARRQCVAGAAQCADYGRADGFFASLAARSGRRHEALPPGLFTELTAAAQAAAAAYGELAALLVDEIAPLASDVDSVGRDRYALHSREFLGSRIDLEETYEWGQQELARIVAETASVAAEILPGASVDEVMVHLDADPRYRLNGTQALQEWMQVTSDATVSALAGTHFDIPQEIRRLECLIAPTEQGGIYYTTPSEDLTRPGRMWWSVPRGETSFSTWKERTTVFHEGVPGHHLQVAQTRCRSDSLNRWRRVASWVSGHGEGWALYAERLMAELGFLDDPADRLGWLDGASLRAARVVLDIGIHCDLPAPASAGGGRWDYDKAWEFLGQHCRMSEGVRRYELDRYLGWPGQAPSYKLGERLWLQLREDARRAAGPDFDLTDFHRRALDIGSVGLDVLREAVLGTI